MSWQIRTMHLYISVSLFPTNSSTPIISYRLCFVSSGKCSSQEKWLRKHNAITCKGGCLAIYQGICHGSFHIGCHLRFNVGCRMSCQLCVMLWCSTWSPTPSLLLAVILLPTPLPPSSRHKVCEVPKELCGYFQTPTKYWIPVSRKILVLGFTWN